LNDGLKTSKCKYASIFFFPHGGIASTGPWLSHFRGFTFTFSHTTFGRIPLNEWSAWRRDHYLRTHNTHKRQTSLPLAGFEPEIPTSELSQTHALDSAAIRIGQRIRNRT